ncbi:uncharacterized protein [Nicotiana sylvestris]|uniref:uncharacterized protein n=1 Tax=Nicotiana sylvestris TaxID=4096 RepID=UPI00388C820B
MAINQGEETSPSTRRNDQLVIDIGNPLYIHPFDSPGMTLVPVPFDGIGYPSWRRSIFCTCGAKKTMHKAEHDRRLIQFLMGLNEVYTIVQGSILMMKPLPSMAQAFSLLIQEEKQREFKPNSQLNLDSTSLHVNASLQHPSPFGAKNFKTHYTDNNNNKGRLFCDYCKRPGHTKEKCYKLHGYPQGNSHNNQNFNRANAQSYNQGNNQNYKFNRGKGSVANIHGTPAGMILENGDDQNLQDENQNVNLTKEQYRQIMNLLQHFQVGHTGGSFSNGNITTGNANFAGIIVCTSSIDFDKPSCKCFELKADLWIIDLGASNHMTFNKRALTNITKLPYPLLVSLPNGYRAKVLEFGDVILTSDIVLHRVLYVPPFKYNLISVYSLAAPSLKRSQVIGNSKKGMYYLCSRCLRGKRTTLPSTISTSYCNYTEHHSESFINDTPSSNTSDSLSSNDNNSQNSSTREQSESPVLRKSNRTHQAPIYLKDYVYQLPSSATQLSTTPHCTPSLNALFSNHNHITPDALFSESQHLMLSVCHDSKPSSYEEAALNPAWQAAITQEFEALHANHTWDLVPLPSGKQAIGCRWVYKIKHKANESIERFKARLAVKGYTQ